MYWIIFQYFLNSTYEKSLNGFRRPFHFFSIEILLTWFPSWYSILDDSDSDCIIVEELAVKRKIEASSSSSSSKKKVKLSASTDEDDDDKSNNIPSTSSFKPSISSKRSNKLNVAYLYDARSKCEL